MPRKMCTVQVTHGVHIYACDRSNTVTIFQTQDPFVRDADLQFIASRKITLNANRELCNETLIASGLGKPGDLFSVHYFLFISL